MKKYKIKTHFIFEGEFEINAENKQEAIENVEKHCGLTMGTIHTTLSANEVPNWNFDMTPTKKIIRINRLTTS